MITMVESHLSSLDREIEIMDSIALNILHSYALKDYYASSLKEDTLFSPNLIVQAQEVSRMLSTIVTPSFAVPYALFHDFEGKSFTSQNGYYIKQNIQLIRWYQDALKQNGLVYLTTPYFGNDSTMSSVVMSAQSLISLCRVSFDNYNVPRGIVEVRQYSKSLFQDLDRLSENNVYGDIMVFNESGKQIYPYNELAPIHHNYLQLIRQNLNQSDSRAGVMTDKSIGHTQFIGYQQSLLSGWTIVITSSEDIMMQGVKTYEKIIILSAICVMIVSLVISYFAAKKITIPIVNLDKRIRYWNITGFVNQNENVDETGIIEIDELNNTFTAMDLQSRESVKNLILAQQQELQFKMLALQSQMNPHFLHNSLANISAMAEEQLTDEISFYTKKLSMMLRYVASGKENIVDVSEEIKHSENYIECLKLRHKEKLQCTIDIPHELYTMKLPKLSIQPLVENSIKFCSLYSPPWVIHIKGSYHSNGWTITVIDNGPGISDKAKEVLNSKIRQIKEEGILPSLELDGMGLLNVYIRLRLLYKEKMTFTIDSIDQKGTSITIGVSNEEV